MPTLAERAHALAMRPGRTLLGIVGAPGAGKSTLAAALHEAVPGSVVVPMDGFHLPTVRLSESGLVAERGTPRTFDAVGYLALLRRLRTIGAMRAPAFDRSVEGPVAEAIDIPADAPLVITEGNYLLLESPPWSFIKGLLDATWFVEVDEGERLRRLIARHVEFGRTQADATERAMTGSDARNAELVRACRDRADLIVTSFGVRPGRTSSATP